MMLLPRRNHYDIDLFDDMFRDPFFARPANQVMKTDITEEGDKYMLSMELPGYSKDDVKIELTDGYLTVSAVKETIQDEKKSNFIHKERFYGECKRSFYVGANVDEANIKASFKDGVLEVSFPKAQTKQIEQKKYIAIE